MEMTLGLPSSLDKQQFVRHYANDGDVTAI
jgi:hypothetical protein